MGGDSGCNRDLVDLGLGEATPLVRYEMTPRRDACAPVSPFCQAAQTAQTLASQDMSSVSQSQRCHYSSCPCRALGPRRFRDWGRTGIGPPPLAELACPASPRDAAVVSSGFQWRSSKLRTS